MSIAIRIKQIRKAKKLSQLEFAKTLSVSQSSVSLYESGNRSPDNAFMSRFAEVFTDINLTWLITGEGEMYNLPIVKDGYLKKTLHLPILGDIAAGFPAEPIEPDQVEYLDVSTTALSMPPPYYVFTVDGESMLPVIYPGDIVVISGTWKGMELDGRICAFRTADGITLKQYVLDVKQKTTWLFPINSRFHPVAYNKDTPDLTLVGVLTLLVRYY